MSKEVVNSLLLVVFLDVLGGVPIVGFFALIFFIIWFFVFVFRSIFHREKFNYIDVLLPVVIIVLEIGSLGLILDYNRKEGIKKGDRIVKALEEYKTKRGQYPESLNELVPEYLSEIPRPKILSFRNEFRYLANDGCHLKTCQEDQRGLRSRFLLFFENSYVENKDYDSDEKVWSTMVR